MIETKVYDLKTLDAVSRDIKQRLAKIPGVFNINSSLNLRSKEVGIEINRNALSNYGLSGKDVAESMLTAIKGKVVSKFREEGREIDIRMMLKEKDRNEDERYSGRRNQLSISRQ